MFIYIKKKNQNLKNSTGISWKKFLIQFWENNVNDVYFQKNSVTALHSTKNDALH